MHRSVCHPYLLTFLSKVLLEFKTGQHFVFPEGGGNAIISNLMGHIQEFPNNCDIYWETEGRKLLMSNNGSVRGLQIRKADGLLYDL